MAETAAVRRYARALFHVAQQQGEVEPVSEDLQNFEALLRATPRLLRVLRAPTIAAAGKRQLLRNAFADRLNALTLRFLEMVVVKRREGILLEVGEEFRKLSYEHLNLLPVQVTSAVALSAQEREALRGALGRRTGRRIELQERVDAALMGGAVLRIGDTILDGSVRGQLRRLRARLLNPSGNGAQPAGS